MYFRLFFKSPEWLWLIVFLPEIHQVLINVLFYENTVNMTYLQGWSGSIPAPYGTWHQTRTYLKYKPSNSHFATSEGLQPLYFCLHSTGLPLFKQHKTRTFYHYTQGHKLFDNLQHFHIYNFSWELLLIIANIVWFWQNNVIKKREKTKYKHSKTEYAE